MSMDHFSYIYCPPLYHPCPASRKVMDSFFYSELERALGEQSFGIIAFQLVKPGTTSLEASAHVTILEGNVVHISLSTRGYQVCNIFSPWTTYLYWSWSAFRSKVVENPRYTAPISSGRIFESIEELLSALSRRYEQRKREALFSQLERLSWQSKLGTVSPWCSQKII